VIDLVLARSRLSRSQFVFTETRGRPAIFWQTQKAARAAPRFHLMGRIQARPTKSVESAVGQGVPARVA
jgi:hypothetical protein